MLDFYLSRDFQLSIKNPSESTEGFKIEVYSEILSKYDRVIACVCFDKKQTKQVPLSFMDGVSQEIFISDIYEYELSKSIDVYCICCDNIPPYDDVSSNTVEIEIPPKKDAVLISKEFNENGVYNASEDNADGYSDVTINVPDESKDTLNSLIDRSITTITSDATYIGQNAFNNCSALTEANFPEVTSLSTNTFSYLYKLKKVNFPKATAISANNGFKNCSALTEVNFPNLIHASGTSVFEYCASLTEVNFPNLLTTGQYAFHGCKSLTEINFPNATIIGNHTFQDCTALTKVNLPSVRGIGLDTFRNCSALTEVNFPKATEIGEGAFRNCSAITEVNLPEHVSFIDRYAFQDCTALQYFDMSEVSVIPRIQANTFNNTTCIFLFRDQTQLDECASATNWSTLANRFQIKGVTT